MALRSTDKRSVNTRQDDMAVLHQVHQWLGPERRERLLQLLASPTIQWRRADQLGRTTSGRAWQLATRRMHDEPEVRQLSRVMASLTYNEVVRTGCVRLPEPALLTPQVFPVRMEGNPHDPPAQSPHRDRSGDRVPTVTALYYLQVDDATGGELVLHDDARGLSDVMAPMTDQLIVIPGSQTHAVRPLTDGYRVTIVTNFYTHEAIDY
jgi:predicted 2-oxoglutarate/Fe(II)-dependent dioxygenase YbiX